MIKIHRYYKPLLLLVLITFTLAGCSSDRTIHIEPGKPWPSDYTEEDRYQIEQSSAYHIAEYAANNYLQKQNIYEAKVECKEYLIGVDKQNNRVICDVWEGVGTQEHYHLAVEIYNQYPSLELQHSLSIKQVTPYQGKVNHTSTAP